VELLSQREPDEQEAAEQQQQPQEEEAKPELEAEPAEAPLPQLRTNKFCRITAGASAASTAGGCGSSGGGGSMGGQQVEAATEGTAEGQQAQGEQDLIIF